MHLTLSCPTPVILHNAIPFVGFGFLDNAIMIVAVSHPHVSLSNCFSPISCDVLIHGRL